MMIIHDSASRSKRYLDYTDKPHIVLSRFSRVFFVDGILKGKDNRFDLAYDFTDKLNAERAKS